MNLDPLKQRLVDTCVYLERLEDEKKYRMGIINEDIKHAKARITALSKAIKEGNMDHLSTIFEGDELQGILDELRGLNGSVQDGDDAGQSDYRERGVVTS